MPFEPALGKYEVRVPPVTAPLGNYNAGTQASDLHSSSMPAMNSTRLGLSKTALPRTFSPNIRNTRLSESARSAKYPTAEMIATRERGGRPVGHIESCPHHNIWQAHQ